MCGITGFYHSNHQSTTEEMKLLIKRMSDTLIHRGPDDQGVWVDEEAGIAFGHRRLAIIDLSPDGHQPMVSHSGRYVLIFNGEIYNYRSLRKDLENQECYLRGNSDTEVALEAIEAWGLKTAVRRFVGMFAFALWDRKERRLHLVRDRLGEKPLYYGWMGTAFLFGSELKTLRSHPSFRTEIDRDALALYMRYNFISEPYSIYKGICKLSPGSILTLRTQDNTDMPRPVSYWSVQETAEKGFQTPFAGSTSDATAELDGLLRDSIRDQMTADVPLGAFLSGGIDSSTVVALMQVQSKRPVKTFTIGFAEGGYDEAKYAKAVAAHLGTEHHELYVTPEQAMQVIPKLPILYDEPFADSSQIPTFLVSELARQHVTVSLSGDGGDELFGGYYRYFTAQGLWNKIGRIPYAFRVALSKSIKTIPVDWLNSGLNWLGPRLAQSGRVGLAGDKLHKLADVMYAERPESLYQNLVSVWRHPQQVVLESQEPPTLFNELSKQIVLMDFIHHMMFIDMVNYLPNDILVKVDRAGMGVSLESRMPMLDHRLVEFAWKIPTSMKIHQGQSKWLLRQVLYQYVPSELVDRPKMGFGVPIGAWLRGPLRQWADELLDQRRLKKEGFFHPELIGQKWDEHREGRRNWAGCLWNVLMFQAWLEYQ